jgi:hypothetical protein
VNAVLVETHEDDCQRCGRAGQVWSRTCGKFIPCPGCSGAYGLPYNPDALRRLARQERKRLRALAGVVVLEVIAEETNAFRKLPAELITTDRVLDRWAAFGSGRPAENPDLYRDSLPVPLDPDTQAVVSSRLGPDPRARVDCYRGSVPVRVRAVTYDLYLRGAPFSWVAKKYRMTPRTLGRYWHHVLRMHRENFLASKYPDLVNLIAAHS